MKFSIITVCLNSEHTIEHTLSSVMTQTHKNLEHIIVDGGSSDDTIKIIKRYPFKNKKIILLKNSGIYDSINFGIKKAKGNVISILHSNDIFQSSKTIENIHRSFLKTSKDIILANVVFFKNDNFKEITRYYTAKNFKPWMLKFGLMPPHTGAFIKRKVYKKTGLYSSKFRIAGDFDFFLKLFLIKKEKYKYVNLTSTRMQAGGISGKNIFSYILSTLEILKSLKNNKITTNILYILLRVPAKMNQFIFKKTKENNRYFEHILDSFYEHIETKKLRVIRNINQLDLNSNFILSALNLAFLGAYSKGEISTHKSLINWPDGIFANIVNKSLIKVPGRDIINKLKIKQKDKIRKIIVLGFLSSISKKFMINKYKLPIINYPLPFGPIKHIIRKSRFKINKNELVFITLPTPKQEQLAIEISKKYKNFKLICIGGSISIISGQEKPVPKWLINFEFIWRLRYETSRRLIRLFVSAYYYLNGRFINKKLNNLKVELI